MKEQIKIKPYQLEHPWATLACGQATKEAEEKDDGARANENIWSCCITFSNQVHIWTKAQLAPYSDSQEDKTGDLFHKHT